MIQLPPKLKRFADLLWQGIDQVLAYERTGFKRGPAHDRMTPP